MGHKVTSPVFSASNHIIICIHLTSIIMSPWTTHQGWYLLRWSQMCYCIVDVSSKYRWTPVSEGDSVPPLAPYFCTSTVRIFLLNGCSLLPIFSLPIGLKWTSLLTWKSTGSTWHALDTVNGIHPAFLASATEHRSWDSQMGQISDPTSILAQTWWVVACLWCHWRWRRV